MATSAKTIAFFGATGGCGLSALRRSLTAGNTCIALCRTPSKLTDKLPTEKQSNLAVIQGNAHDAEAVARYLVKPSNPSQLVDMVLFTIGGSPVMKWSGLTLDDPHVCEHGMDALLKALSDLRAKGVTGSPHIVVISTCGISKYGRDYPLLTMPLYKIMLRVPHADKKPMEEKLVKSGEKYTIVRPSLLTAGEETQNEIRAGVEDLNRSVIESKAIGYTISREDTGRWIFEQLIRDGKDEGMYGRKAVVITY